MGAFGRNRSGVYRALLGFAVGSLAAGLLLPFVVGDSVPDTSVEVGGAPSGSSDLAVGDTGAGQTPGEVESGALATTTTTAPAAAGGAVATAGGAPPTQSAATALS